MIENTLSSALSTEFTIEVEIKRPIIFLLDFPKDFIEGKHFESRNKLAVC